MLSSKLPSDASCSYKPVACWGVGADAATSSTATDTPPPARDESPDLAQPCPTFSIRDYAFDSRSKGIKRSWPFRPQSLELCLKRGVKDLLPPFEPPDLLRSRPFYTCIDVEQSAACSEPDAFVGSVETREDVSSNVNTAGINLQPCQLADESLSPSQYTPTEDGKTSTDTEHSNVVIQADQEHIICTKAIRRTEAVLPSCRLKYLGSSRGTSEKKGKFLVKSGSMKNIRQTKDVLSNSSSVLDPNASKTCPVCKVFSSTSNTTLNAHIDQCLYAVSNTELVVETVIVKPKVKQMKKQLMVDIYKTTLPYTLEDLDKRNGTNWAIELSVPTVNKVVCRKNRSPKMVLPEARDGERDRDVYVDSNGTKIRILSKCIDAPLVLRDELGLKKVAKNDTGKSMNKKFKVHGKKCNRLNHLKPQVGDIHDDTSEEEPAMHTRKPTESTSCGGSETIRRWVCSKRSDISKSFSTKLNNKASDSMKPGTKKLARSGMLGFDDPQITESYSEAFSPRSTEEIATTSEVNDDDHGNSSSRLLGSIPRWSSETPSSSSAFPKVPRSAATLAKRKIKEIGRREASKSDKYDTLRRISTMAKGSGACLSVSITGLSNEPKRTVSTSKVLRKHRSLSRTRKREFSPSLSGLLHGFSQENELDNRNVNNKFSITKNGTSKKLAKHTQEDTTDNDAVYGTDVPALGQGGHQYDVAQQTASRQMDHQGEEHATQVQYTSVSRNTHEDCCSAICSGPSSPGNSKTADEVLAKGSLSMEDPCSTEQSTHRNHASNTVADNEKEEWQIDPASTKESSICFTSNRDVGLATPQDNSSVTSNREDSKQDNGFLAFDRDSSNSPISIASTISSPIALKDSRIKGSGPGPSAVSVIRTVEQSMSVSSNQETKSMPPVREGEQLSNEKLYCCSCRESISREPHLDHESSTARSDTYTAKQVPQLHMGLRTSSSFSTYQRTDRKANPCLDSHDQQLTGKVSTESSMSFRSYMTDCIRPSLQTQLPSPPSPMLRLMGKNLMVMNSQESGHPQAPSSDYMLRGNYMAPPVGFVPANYQHSDSAFIGRTPSITSQHVPLPSVQAGNFVGPPVHGGFMVQPNHHSLQKPYTNHAPVIHRPNYMMKEVIMIYDDSTESRSEPQVGMLFPTGTYPTPVPNTSVPRPFYCHPSPVPVLPRESFAGYMPVFRNISPMVGVSTFSQRNQFRYSQPLHHTPSHVQTPEGYMNPPVYYSQDFR